MNPSGEQLNTDHSKPSPAESFKGEGLPFGGYRLIRKIAVGGMAEVYLALNFGNFGFQRQEVIKALLPTLAKNKEFVEMFIHEAIVSAEFRHPNLVQVYNLGKVEGLYFLAMEFVDGVDLMRLVRRCRQVHKPIPIDVVLNIISQAADGLAAVHEARSADGELLNIVHRDVNPQNLMITFNGQSKLVDFGVAQTLLAQAEAEQALMGKGPYMAPEQWRGDDIDPRSDIFALGTVLYELTVGRRLFRRTSAEKTKKAIMSGDVPKPSKMRKGFPKDLESVILKALALNPRDRYPNTRAMRRDIETVQNRMGGALHSDDVAIWMQDTFKGLTKDELWPKLDLTAPGQLTEAQEVLRRSLWSLPAFSESPPQNGSQPRKVNPEETPKNKPPRKHEQKALKVKSRQTDNATQGDDEEETPDNTSGNSKTPSKLKGDQKVVDKKTSLYVAATVFLAGLAVGSIITAILIHFL